ncbi:modifier of mdg4 isoform X1 [Stomoxys calcitrans]|uniref:BTB domain-containing protein n=1 Tax=Stomoxys calcitrans TaxID=35570 RepID=A0A1I8PGT0_STOCA|nr:modifier of mdg4 isoform X1 [Stomoxys calcitrans]XP_059220134.1 modifier of mdg4 isoform X1 [Stomoxys calcitrans]
MADDEQFSLCWNNFNSNLSAGFHESLCRGDLVDVTLAAEGQFVKAHRLVLSVCSPYFRKMFTQMPANQHAFVFLKDVSHTALKDLIQFMYCGEVNVKQEALPAFISTAEALQIKGLTDSDPPQSQTPPEPSTPTPQIQSQQIQASPRVRHRTSTGRSYKIETVDDSGDDTKQTTQIVIQTTAPSHPPQATITTQAPQQQHHHHHHHQQQQQHQPPQQHIAQQPIQTQTHQLAGVSLPTSTATTAVVTHKRPAQRTNLGSVPHIKRSKSTIDPLEASDATVATQQLNVQTTVVTSDVTKSQSQQHHHHQQQQQTQSHHHQSQPQQTNEPEYIDMPMELPTKSEPDYVEDAGEVDQGEQDGTYVEDESYGDMRYDESYFTEGEEAGGAAGNAATGGATSTSATATTSKAIVKSQPLSDSAYMDSTGDQANSDAQATPDNDALLKRISPNKARGRPRKNLSDGGAAGGRTGPKLVNKIIESINNNPGQPILYASTTKGTMKLVVDGHHFRYIFRKGSYSIFQCCYKENKEECAVRVVTDQKLVYPLDGEHVHFIQATDKSVTAVKFTPGQESDVEQTEQSPPEAEHTAEVENMVAEDVTTHVNMDNDLPQQKDIDVKLERGPPQDQMEFTSTTPPQTQFSPIQTSGATEDPNIFREKIKKRLQKALLGKKK